MTPKPDVVRSFAAFDALRDEWNALAWGFGRPLLRQEWFSCCARAFHEDGDLAIVAVRSAGRLIAAAPLVRVRSRGRDRLQLLGALPLNEPSGVIFESEEALAELAQRVVTLGLPVWLGRLEADSAAVRVFSERSPRATLVFRRSTHPSLGVESREAWGAYFETLSPTLRWDLKRKRRRAEQIGPVRSETLAPTPDEARILLDAVMQVEASGWKGRSGSAMRFNRRVGAFFRRYAPLAAANGHLRVSLLHVGSHLAAADLSLEADRRLWQLKIGYDESLARCSPGLLLTHDTLAYAFSHRLEAFEFLGSAEAWQERWGAVPRQYASILGYPLTPRGLWGLTVDGVGRTIERLRAKRLRRAVRESAGATT